MKKTLWIEGIILFLVSLVTIAEGLRIALEKDPLVSKSDMLGPGYYVLLLGIVLAIANIIYLVIHARKRLSSGPQSRGMKTIVLNMIAICAIYSMLISVIGYLAASILFFFLAYRTSGVRSLFAATVLAFVTTSLFYLIFMRSFSMSLPKGLFF